MSRCVPVLQYVRVWQCVVPDSVHDVGRERLHGGLPRLEVDPQGTPGEGGRGGETNEPSDHVACRVVILSPYVETDNDCLGCLHGYRCHLPGLHGPGLHEERRPVPDVESDAPDLVRPPQYSSPQATAQVVQLVWHPRHLHRTDHQSYPSASPPTRWQGRCKPGGLELHTKLCLGLAPGMCGANVELHSRHRPPVLGLPHVLPRAVRWGGGRELLWQDLSHLYRGRNDYCGRSMSE